MNVRSIPLNSHTINTVARVEDAKLAEMIKQINGDFKDVKYVSIVYSNAGAADLSKIFDSEFRVRAIMPDHASVAAYVEQQRNLYPAVTFRVLDLFEGRLASFYEHRAPAFEQEEAA